MSSPQIQFGMLKFFNAKNICFFSLLLFCWVVGVLPLKVGYMKMLGNLLNLGTFGKHWPYSFIPANFFSLANSFFFIFLIFFLLLNRGNVCSFLKSKFWNEMNVSITVYKDLDFLILSSLASLILICAFIKYLEWFDLTRSCWNTNNNNNVEVLQCNLVDHQNILCFVFHLKHLLKLKLSTLEYLALSFWYFSSFNVYFIGIPIVCPIWIPNVFTWPNKRSIYSCTILVLHRLSLSSKGLSCRITWILKWSAFCGWKCWKYAWYYLNLKKWHSF